MNQEEVIKNFKEKIRQKVFGEYTKNGFVKNQVCLLGKNVNDDWFIAFKRVPGFLHLDGDELDDMYSQIQRMIHKFIRVVKEDSNDVLCLVHIESGEEDGKDYIFTSFKTGDEFDDVDIESYRVEKPPVTISETGEITDEKPLFIRVDNLLN